jgi:hypothetical protein
MRGNQVPQGRRFGGGARFGVLMGGILAAIGLLLAVPAMGWAAKASFGAQLNQPGFSPVNSPVKCKWDQTAACTRLPLFYAEPSPAGMNEYAPYSGVIKTIKLIAKNPGKLRIQLGEANSQGQPTGEVESNGPKIQYKGTGKIETFKVHIPVLKFDYVGFRTKRANTLSCSQPGLESSYQFEPALKPGAPSQVSSWQEECTHLIKAKMAY